MNKTSSGSIAPADSNPPLSSWAQWAAFFPEVANAGIVAVAAFAALERVIWPYSDADIQASLVDTYEPSAWGILIVCVVGLVGIGAAALVIAVAASRTRRWIAVWQIVLLVACIAIAGWQHHGLMERTTALTGQTFSGFP